MIAEAMLLDTRAPDTLQASRDRVDVWVVRLAENPDGAALETLDAAERAHAARLRVATARWVAARVALRRVLGGYLGTDARSVRIEAGPNGKPRLAPGAASDLRFNLSHSGDLALIAVRLGYEVGVDVERVRSGVDGDAIAREFFSARERATIEPRAGENPARAFFRAWVAREALAKATGRGIASACCEEECSRFDVRELQVMGGYAAALASEGVDWGVRTLGSIEPELFQRLRTPRRRDASRERDRR